MSTVAAPDCQQASQHLSQVPYTAGAAWWCWIDACVASGVHVPFLHVSLAWMAAFAAPLPHWVLTKKATLFTVPPWHGGDPGSPYDQLHTEVKS